MMHRKENLVFRLYIENILKVNFLFKKIQIEDWKLIAME